MRFRTETDSPLRLIAQRTQSPLRCSFCGQSEKEVKKLVVGPQVSICNDCVDICNEIIADELELREAAAKPPPS
jgi:ATP-dependent Clp protease ATP-binding subunit ClpX